MSVIACIRPDVYPVLLADILTSSKQGNKALVLPTVGPVVETGNERRLRAHGIVEKIVRINDHLIAAWAADDVSSAIRILRSVASIFRNDPTSVEEIAGFVGKYHPEDLKKCALIFVVKEPTGQLSALQFNCREINVPPIGSIWIAGSGSNHVAGHFGMIPPEVLQVGNEIRQGLCIALTAGGALLANELRTGSPLADHFGGGYEIGSIIGESAAKLDDFACCFWFGALSSTGEVSLRFPQKVIRRYELHGQTRFYCLEFEWTEQGPRVKREDIFMINRLLSEKVDLRDARSLPDLNSRWQVNAFCFDLPSGQHHVSLRLDYQHERHQPLIRFSDNGQVQLSIDFQLVEEAFRRLLRKNPPSGLKMCNPKI